MPRPNILLILSDEHDPAVAGCYGDEIVDTPNLDNLAARGVTFDAAYCNSPLCVPSRLSLTAGQYISRCGAWSNADMLPCDEHPSLPRALQAAGYETFLGGKMHFDKSRRYGWNEIYSHPDNQVSKDGRGGRRRADDESVNVANWEERVRDFHVGENSEVLDLDREVTAQCSQFLRERKADDAPFLLLAGYLAPHFPLIVPQEIADKYRDRVPMPDLPDGLVEGLPLNYHQLRRGFGLNAATPSQTKNGRELYWALTEWFDGEVGKLLGALEDSAVAENTIVIYTSDHGENKGDHGLWWKNCLFEHGARVPLIVSWPARWAGGQRRSEACSLVDLVQTIIEIAGAEPDKGMDGDSMVGWLDIGAGDWKDTALSEYYGHNIASGMTMWREGEWKYIYHARMDENHAPQRELYHLADDPKEFENLANQSEHAERIAAMHTAMVTELGEEPDAIEARCRASYAR